MFLVTGSKLWEKLPEKLPILKQLIDGYAEKNWRKIMCIWCMYHHILALNAYIIKIMLNFVLSQYIYFCINVIYVSIIVVDGQALLYFDKDIIFYSSSSRIF